MSDGVLIGAGVGLLVALGLLIFLLARRSDPSRAIATVRLAPDAPVELRFQAPSERAHSLWVRFEVLYHGGEDDYGVAVETEARTSEGVLLTVEKRAGERAPAIGPHFSRWGGLYRVHEWSTPHEQGVKASMEMGRIPGVPVGTEIVVTGRVALGRDCRLAALEVFVLPG
ncbi:MAG: hypothetical protein R3B82_16670 [Sandaracinaceae bacterium]